MTYDIQLLFINSYMAKVFDATSDKYISRCATNINRSGVNKLEINNFKEIKMKELSLKEMEKVFIINRFHQLNDNRTHTARSLGIGIRTLQRKLKEYGIEPGRSINKLNKNEESNASAI